MTVPHANAESDRKARIAALLEALHETEQELSTLIDSNADDLTSQPGRKFLLQKAQAQLLPQDEIPAALPNTHLLQAVVDGIPNFVYVKDLQGRYLLCNKAFATFKGRSVEQIAGSDDRALYGAVEAKALADHDRALLAAGTEQVAEQWLTGVKGRRKLELTCTPYRNAQGEVIGVIGIARDITDDTPAQQALRDSEAMLDIAGRMAKVGGWRRDMNTGHLYWSDMVARLHDEPAGYSSSLEEGIASFVAEHRAVVREAVERCATLGISYDLEVEKVSATGRRFWVRTMGEAVRDDAGRIVRTQGALQDITERKLAALETQKMAVRLTNTLESITDGFYTVDRDWRFSYVNGQAERLLGRSREALLGRVIWEMYPDLGGTDFDRGYLRAMGGETGISFETFYPPLNSWFGVDCHPSEDGLSVYFRDVSARRATQQQLELLEASVAQLNDMVVISEPVPGVPRELRIVFVNDAFERLTGYRREEVIGRSQSLLNGPLTDPAQIDRLQAAFSRFEPIHAELLNYTKLGEPHWVEIDITPVSISGEQCTHFVSIERDISERRQNVENLRLLNAGLEERVRLRTQDLDHAREMAEQANRAKSSFLAMMSHEIRTPMNGVVGMIDVLEASRLRPEQIDLVKTARESAYALMAIVDDVLDFSKIEAGQFDINHEPMDVTAVIESVCDGLRPVSERQAVGLRLYTDPRLPASSLGDAARLRQVLTNLLGNAIKFSHGLGRRGAVSLRALRVGDCLQLEVADNGIGMAPETLTRLFSPFTQADASTTRRFGGTGLGLSISHRLVSLMGGDMEVRSVMDQGTTFTVRLPMALLPDVDTQSPRIPQPLLGLSCLVVGNGTGLGADLCDYLHHAGALTTCLQSAEQAQAWLRSGGLERRVVVIADTPENNEPIMAACRAAVDERPESALGFVVVEDGGLVQPPRQALDHEWLSGECLHRAKFLRSVALAAQLQQPQPAEETPLYFSHEPDESLEGTRPLILVAEDNEINQKVLSHQLTLLGYRAEMAADGAEALACWRRGGHALLLTDLHMPVMDGYTLASAVRAEEGVDGRMPIIALTANALREEELRCRAAGMDAYLSKPVRLEQLKATIDAWLRPVATPALLPGNAVIEEVAATVQPPVDLRVLADLLGGDTEGMQQVLTSFRKTTAGSAQAMTEAYTAGAAQTLFDIAHKLKSTARAIGAVRLGQVCADIEEATANKQQSEMLDALVSDFEVELLAVRDFLDKHEASGDGFRPPLKG